MSRIDLEATVRRIDFPPETWECVDLLGDMLILTQEEAARHEGEIADTPTRKLLVLGTQRMISCINAAYFLLRCEYMDHAATQVRLLCEGLIVLSHVMLDPEKNVPRFKEYYYIEAYETASTLLELEKSVAARPHVEAMQEFLRSITPDFDRLRPSYTFTITRGRSKGKQKPYRNWCNKTVPDQATECGPDLERLYHLVYKEMSSYVHWSAYSLRRQVAYSARNYDPRVVYTDMAKIVRTIAVLWLEFARFTTRHLGWGLERYTAEIVGRCETLDAKYCAARHRHGDA